VVAIDASDDQTFFAPVKLEGITLIELKRHKGLRCFTFLCAPFPDELRHLGVAAGIAGGTDLRQQRLCSAALVARTMGIGLERLHDRIAEWVQLLNDGTSLIFWRCLWLRLAQPSPDSVTGQASAPGDFVQRELVAQVHAADLA